MIIKLELTKDEAEQVLDMLESHEDCEKKKGWQSDKPRRLNWSKPKKNKRVCK